MQKCTLKNKLKLKIIKTLNRKLKLGMHCDFVMDIGRCEKKLVKIVENNSAENCWHHWEENS